MMPFTSQLHQGWGYERMNARGKQFPVPKFRCRAYRAKLIPSRVHQCVPTLGQPGILYLFNYTDVFNLLITLDWHLPANQPLFLWILVV